MTAARKKPFNGAPLAAFDQDGKDGPGGGVKAAAPDDANADANGVRVPLIELATGWLLRLAPAEAAEAVAAETARYATHQDLEIAGRPDLTPFIAG